MNRSDGLTATTMSQGELRSVLTAALRAGQLLLFAGADMQRVEETVHRIGAALGATGMEVYVTPTGIIASALSGPEHRTRIARVTSSSVDLRRIDAINQLSRSIEYRRMTPDQVIMALEAIAKEPREYSQTTTVAMTALACACLSQIYGGGWHEFVAVLLAASIALALREQLAARGAGLLLQVPPVAFVATITLALFAQVLDLQQFDNVVPSAVLFLVPGVPFITALTDLLGNYLISGVARVAQASMIIIEIGVGVALALALLRAWGVGA